MLEYFWLRIRHMEICLKAQTRVAARFEETQIGRLNVSQTTWQFLQGSVAAAERLPGSSFTAVYHQAANIPSCGTINGGTPEKSGAWITLLMTEQHRLRMATCEAARCVCSSIITCAAALSDRCKLLVQLSRALFLCCRWCRAHRRHLSLPNCGPC